MAFSLDTSGFNVTVPQGNAPLESLKPLSMAGASPLQIKPLAGWSIPSAHPELVAQGISQGLSAIGQGIQVAYQQKRQDIKDAATIEREKTKDAATVARETAKEAATTARENRRYDQQQQAEAFKEQQWADRIAGVLPNGKEKPLFQNYAPIGDASSPAAPSAPSVSEPLDYRGVGPLKDPGVTTTGKSLSSLSMPTNEAGQFLSATYNPAAADTQRQTLQNLALNNMSGIQGTMASTSQGAPGKQLSSEPQFQFNPSEAANDAAYAKSLEQAQTAAAPSKESPEFRAFPPTPEGYAAADRERKKSYEGYGEHPRIVEDKEAGGYRVDWQHADESKAQRMRTAQQNSIRREQSSFYAQPEIKNFTAANGVRQALPKFMTDLEAAKKFPKAAGIHQVGLLDMYVRAESGGVVREGTAAQVLNASSLPDKLRILGLKPQGGDFLAEDQMDAMARVITGNHNASARLANQNIMAARERLKSEGITDENQLPQPYKIAITREEIADKVQMLKKQAIAEKDRAKQKELINQANKIAAEIPPGTSFLVNMDDILDSRQGYGGGVPPALVQTEQ